MGFARLKQSAGFGRRGRQISAAELGRCLAEKSKLVCVEFQGESYLGAFSDLLEKPNSGQQDDNKYLRLDMPDWNPKNPQSSTAVVRILDQRPVRVYRHWFETADGRQVPLNCPGRENCPACAVRGRMYKANDPAWKQTYRSDTKYLFNVATEIEGELQVRIWSVGSRLLKDIDFYTNRKGYEDVRTYDFELSRTRIGPATMNVEWKVFPSPPTGFTQEYQDLLEKRFDLNEEILSATTEEIKAAMVEQSGIKSENGTSKAASFEQLAELNALASAKEYTLEGLGIEVGSLTFEEAERHIEDLKS